MFIKVYSFYDCWHENRATDISIQMFQFFMSSPFPEIFPIFEHFLAKTARSELPAVYYTLGEESKKAVRYN
jgi:hypothetical protein